MVRLNRDLTRAVGRREIEWLACHSIGTDDFGGGRRRLKRGAEISVIRMQTHGVVSQNHAVIGDPQHSPGRQVDRTEKSHGSGQREGIESAGGKPIDGEITKPRNCVPQRIENDAADACLALLIEGGRDDRAILGNHERGVERSHEGADIRGQEPPGRDRQAAAQRARAPRSADQRGICEQLLGALQRD